jgi:tetratricopeptide (TPR) repeat protein
MLLEDVQYDVIDDFIAKIAPQKVSYEIDLIDSAEKNWTKEQKNILKNAMNFIEDERYNEAQQLLVSLVNSTNRQSFVALYNLGIVLEAKAKYDESKLIYKEASKLYSKDVGLSIEAINRITNTQKSEIEAINEIEK